MCHSFQVIFWLLLVATFAIDAVAITWLRQDTNQHAAATLCDALAFGQLSVVTIWWSLGRYKKRTALWAWSILTASIVIVAAFVSRIYDFSFREAAVVYGTHVALLAVTLWIVKQIDGGKGVPSDIKTTSWQFSVGQLLALTSVTALIIGSLQDTAYLHYVWSEFAVAVITSSITATVAVIVWLRRSHALSGLVSLATLSATAVVLAAIVSISVNFVESLATGNAARVPVGSYPTSLQFLFHSVIIQCLVIYVWLALGRIIPDRGNSAN